MKSRALYVLVETDGGQPRVAAHQSAFGAGTLDKDMFWGAEPSIEFVRRQEVVELAVLERAIDIGGGAVIDVPNRSLLLFGGDLIAEDPPLRRVYVELLGIAWGGFKVDWAHAGLADLARHLGVLRPAVVDDCVIDEFESPAGPIVDDAEWTEAVATVCWSDGVCNAYPLAWEAESVLLWGEAFVDALAGAPRHHLVRMQEIPSGGIHLDVRSKRIDYWLVGTAPGLAAKIADRWPGWTCRWRHDDYEKHRALAGGCLYMMPEQESVLLGQLESLLGNEAGGSPLLNLFDEVAQDIAMEVPLPAVGPALRQAILRRALAEFRSRRRGSDSSSSDTTD